MQSLGLVVLLRGVVHRHDVATSASIVAGSTILVVAFVALNLLAQRFGALRASAALDYYAALPVSPAAVVLGTAASYASFTVPGALLTAVVGVAIYGLPFGHLWVVVPAVVVAAVALSGCRCAARSRPAAYGARDDRGQLGMTAVLFLGIISPTHLPVVAACGYGPSSRAFLRSMRWPIAAPHTDWVEVVVRLGVTRGVRRVRAGPRGPGVPSGGRPMSDPSPATAAPPDWQHWQVIVTEPWPAPDAAEATVRLAVRSARGPRRSLPTRRCSAAWSA